jgi:Double-GTPase 2
MGRPGTARSWLDPIDCERASEAVSGSCKFEGCTVAETGKCAVENDPDTCPNRIAALAPAGANGSDTNSDGAADSFGAPVLPQPVENPSFPRSTTLGSEVIEQMMSSRYVNVIGILGEPESGKTACLASLYLLVSNAKLEGWSFADSRSLMAFEESSRGARRWNEGNPPEQMTVHTEMANDRQPGFLHIKLVRSSDQRSFDFALPDLPGEWTKALIRSSVSDRLAFLKSVDVIWIVVDGRTLISKEQRQGVISRLGQLAGRLRALIEGAMPRVLLVLTHRDGGEVPDSVLQRVNDEVAKYGLNLTVVPVAPFSDDNKFKPGFGLTSLLDATVGEAPAPPDIWPSRKSTSNTRSFLAHRRVK